MKPNISDLGLRPVNISTWRHAHWPLRDVSTKQALNRPLLHPARIRSLRRCYDATKISVSFHAMRFVHTSHMAYLCVSLFTEGGLNLLRSVISGWQQGYLKSYRW